MMSGEHMTPAEEPRARNNPDHGEAIKTALHRLLTQDRFELSYVEAALTELDSLLTVLDTTTAERDEALQANKEHPYFKVVQEVRQRAEAAEARCRALTETLDGVGKYLAREMPNSLLTQKVRAVLAAAGSSTAAPCSECDGRGEVAVTRGMPGDGPMQCPACAGSSANPEESEA
jgi:hypothetical protein